MRTSLLSVLVLGLAVGCGGSSSSKGNNTASGSTASTNTGSTAGTSSSSTGTTTSTSGTPGTPGGSATTTLTVTSIAPDSGPLDGGTAVVIRGAGFQAAGAGETFVLFGDQGLIRVNPSSDSELRFNAPVGRSAGQYDLRVVNELGSARLGGAWTYGARRPQLSYAPNVGHHELGLGGTRITLSTSRFAPVTSATTVTFDGTPAASISVVDSNTLIAEVPDGLTPGQVAIEVSEGGQAVSQPGFTVQGQLSYGDLIVNEFCPHPGGIDSNQDGVGDSKADEFVEIVNTTSQPIDLTYLTIWDAADKERHRFQNPTTLPPGGAITVFGGGTPAGFTRSHGKGSAQQATTGELALNNSADSIEIRTQPGLSSVGRILFKVEYTNPPTGSSFVNRNDGQPIVANPATSADYVDHVTVPNAPQGWSPSRKADGSRF